MFKLHVFHALVLIYTVHSLLSFYYHNPLFLYQQSNPNGTNVTVHSAGGTSHTHLYADDAAKVPMTNHSCFVTTLTIHEYNRHCSQITTYNKLFVPFQITTPALATHNVSVANAMDHNTYEVMNVPQCLSLKLTQGVGCPHLQYSYTRPPAKCEHC
jgi:hypothetical protein